MSEDTQVACDNCGYTWKYEGDAIRTTCPNCSQEIPTGLIRPQTDSDATAEERIEDLRRQYAEGDISLDELEQSIDRELARGRDDDE